MSTEVTVTLPDEVYRRAERLARLTGREVADVLVDTIEISLQPFAAQPGTDRPVTTLSDEEVLALTDLQLETGQDRRLSVLLDTQQAGWLTEAERTELRALMQLYEEGLLRKAQALREAVRRGLREPLGA